MPSCQSAGMPSMARERSITSASAAFGALGAMAAAEQRARQRVQRQAGTLGAGAGGKIGIGRTDVRLGGDCHVRLSLSEEKRPGGGA